MLATLDMGRRADWLLRALHELGPTARVGLGFVNRDDERGSNRVLHLDQDFRTGRWGVDTNWVSSWVDERHSGDAANLFLYYQSPRWFAKVEPHFVRPGIQDDLGFIPFADFKGLNSSLRFSREWRRGPLRSFSIGGDASDTHHYDGTLFQQQRNASFDIQSRSNHSLGFGWSGGRFEEFDDSVFSVNLGARITDPFHNFGIGYSWGRRAGDPYRFITPNATWRFGGKFTVGISSALLYHTEDAQQHIVTFNYDLSPDQGIGGRLVAETGGTNGYLAMTTASRRCPRSGYGGVETFLILGDPNARKFRPRVALKVLWAM